MKRANDKRGISLIVLVITIIIMIIIAGAVILTLSGSGVITKSRLAKEGSDFAAIREAVELGKQNMLLTGEFDKNRINIPNIYEDDIEVTSTGAILIKYNPNTKILDMANAIKILGATYISNGFDEIQSLNGETAYAGETKLAKIIIEGKSEQDIPSGYTFYDYIESTGTQYIDTGFKPNNNTKVEMKINITTLPTPITCLFGGRDAVNKNNFSVWAIVGTNMRWDYASNQLAAGNLVVGDNTIIKDKNTNILNGVTISTNTLETFQSIYNLTLFGTNTAGTVNYPSAFRLKKCKIWDNGTLIRNMIPAKKNSDNKVGMYDLVNNVFYSNAGTGVFSTGTEITLPTRDYPVTIKSISNFDLVSSGENLLFQEDNPGQTTSGLTLRTNNGSTVINGQTTGSIAMKVSGDVKLGYINSWLNGNVLLHKNTEYTMKITYQGTLNNQTVGLICSDGSLITLPESSNIKSGKTFTIKPTKDIIDIYILFPAPGVVVNVTDLKIMLNYGSVSFPYEVSKQNTINFPYTLCSLPDGTKDYIEIDNVNRTTKLYRNVGEVVLNGSETWSRRVDFTPVPGLKTFVKFSLPNGLATAGIGLCSHFKVIGDAVFSYENTRIYYPKTGSINITISDNTLGIIETDTDNEMVSKFKSWITTNPVTVQYKLETPIVTDLPYQELQVGYPATNVYTTSIVKPKIIGQVINK